MVEGQNRKPADLIRKGIEMIQEAESKTRHAEFEAHEAEAERRTATRMIEYGLHEVQESGDDSAGTLDR